MKGHFYRPAAQVKFSAGLDGAGNPVSYSARTSCSSVFAAAGFPLKDDLDQTAVEGLKELPYDCPNVQVEWSRYEPGIGVWFWRSVGHSQNFFFSESFIDEMAVAAGKDPFEYRRGLLTRHPRHKAALELAANKAGWGSPLPAGRARASDRRKTSRSTGEHSSAAARRPPRAGSAPGGCRQRSRQ